MVLCIGNFKSSQFAQRQNRIKNPLSCDTLEQIIGCASPLDTKLIYIPIQSQVQYQRRTYAIQDFCYNEC